MTSENQTVDFCLRLRQAIRSAGKTQSELARDLGVRDATVSDWFNRGTMPSGAIMIHLPHLLGCNGHWLLTGETPSDARSQHGLDVDERTKVAVLIASALEILHPPQGSMSHQHLDESC